MQTIRTGIIGIGGMGSGHALRLTAGEVQGMELTAVADIDGARLAWASANLPHTVARFGDGAELSQSGAVDAVIVATPHELHPVFAKQALLAGLHAFVEKPAGVYTKAVREVNAVADASDKAYGVMFNQRTDPVYRKLKQIVESGEMGALRRVNWIITSWYRPQSYYDSGSWRATWAGEGGGVLINQCPHNLDLLQWICGMPVRVRAFVHHGKWHRIEVEDDVSAYMEFENGATGIFVTSTGDAPGTNRLELTLDRGKLVCEDGRITRFLLEIPEPVFRERAAQGFSRIGYTVDEIRIDEPMSGHTGVLQAYADHILNGTPQVADGREGIRALDLSNAIHLSGWTNESIELPVDEERFLRALNALRSTSAIKNVKTVTLNPEGSYR